MGLFSTFVVPSDSASIGHSSEKVLSIPKDHTEMAKFATANEIGFVRVSNKIREWVKEISNRITGMFNIVAVRRIAYADQLASFTGFELGRCVSILVL